MGRSSGRRHRQSNAAKVIQNGPRLFGLAQVDIAPHSTTANYFQHEARAKRRLLLHKSEIRKLEGETAASGATLVPLSLYFNDRNLLKVELAVCRGKNVRDKRQDIRERDDKRMMSRLSKGL